MTGTATDANSPQRAIWWAFAWAGLRLSALFALVFYGADAWAAHRALRWQFYADWELAIPYWPPAYLLYHSVFLLPVLLACKLRNADRLRHWERAMATAIVLAGVVFVLLPAELGFAPLEPGTWSPVAQFTGLVAGRHNLLPSLHVALSLLTLCWLWPLVGARLRLALGGWWLLLVASVLLTHQHHLADVLAGAALGAWLGRGATHPHA